MNEQLTKDFNRNEFACRGLDCCSGSAPINIGLVVALQELRDLVGVPLRINSGFRCRTHNRTLGSQDDSEHCLGNAADVKVPDGYGVDEFATLAETIPDFANGGIGRYPVRGFVHLDVRDEKARWTWGDSQEKWPTVRRKTRPAARSLS